MFFFQFLEFEDDCSDITKKLVELCQSYD